MLKKKIIWILLNFCFTAMTWPMALPRQALFTATGLIRLSLCGPLFLLQMVTCRPCRNPVAGSLSRQRPISGNQTENCRKKLQNHSFYISPTDSTFRHQDLPHVGAKCPGLPDRTCHRILCGERSCRVEHCQQRSSMITPLWSDKPMFSYPVRSYTVFICALLYTFFCGQAEGVV